MRIRMKHGLAAMAVPAMALGLFATTGGQALAAGHVTPAATTVCNNSNTPCTNISSLLLNQGNSPTYFQNVVSTGVGGGSGGGGGGGGGGCGFFCFPGFPGFPGHSVLPNVTSVAGSRINLAPASDTATSEDFIITRVGNLGQLCGSGVNAIDPTGYACLNYGTNYPVYQAQYAPNSTESGYCVGAATVTAGQAATLQKCGSPKTFFIADLASDITITLPGPLQPLIYFPLEAAADTSASNALVLTLNTNSSNPSNGLYLQQENRSGGKVIQAQMFTLSGTPGI
jgi:hypothetical protein